MKAIYRLFGCFTIVLISCIPVLADVTISPDGSGDHPTIQAGIIAISAGETVWLTDGTFSGTGNKDLNFDGKDVTVRSISDDPNLCIIDCESEGHGFFLYNEGTLASEIRGLSVIHGYEGDGGGILLYHGSATVTNCIISDCESYYGGAGVYCYDGTLMMSECIVRNNTCYADSDEVYGGGVYIHSGGQSTISNCLIQGNVCDSEDGGNGGGIYTELTDISILNCEVSGNMLLDEVDDGGGIYLSGSTPTEVLVKNCLISGNSAPDGEGGGLYLGTNTSGSAVNCTIIGNSAGRGGGGLVTYNSQAKIINSTISNNTAGLMGGGIYLFGALTTTEAVNCIFWNNSAPSGPEIALTTAAWNSTLTISYSNVQWGAGSVYIDPGCTLNWGNGMISADPRFIGGSPFDYHLSGTSPVIDRGTSDTGMYPALPGDDRDGDMRPLHNGYDMGSDEFSGILPPCIHHGDVNFNGTVTAADAQLAFFIVMGTTIPSYAESCAADCNDNGSVTAGDAQEIFALALGLGTCAEDLL